MTTSILPLVDRERLLHLLREAIRAQETLWDAKTQVEKLLNAEGDDSVEDALADLVTGFVTEWAVVGADDLTEGEVGTFLLDVSALKDS
jgi:hypothetical protein